MKPYTRKFNVCTPVTDPFTNDTKYWIRCGTAFENRRSQKITIGLDALPVQTNDKGQVVLVLFERENDEGKNITEGEQECQGEAIISENVPVEPSSGNAVARMFTRLSRSIRTGAKSVR